MLDPRPRMTSARPFEMAFSVEKRWNTRTGLSGHAKAGDPRRRARDRRTYPAPARVESRSRWSYLANRGVDGTLELGPFEDRAEDGSARLQDPAGAKAAEQDGVVADPVDDLSDHPCGVGIVPGHTDRMAVGRAWRSAAVLEVLVSDLVERLDDCGLGEPPLHDLAARKLLVVKQRHHPVRRRPVVHRVHDELAGKRAGVES